MTQPVTAPTYGHYRWFARRIGQFLGIGADWNAWNHEQEGDVHQIIQEGLMQYYYPPPLEGVGSYGWSFLEPTVEPFMLAAEVREYDLPEDFERFSGPLTYAEDDGNYFPPIRVTSDRRIRAMNADTNYSSWPRFVCTRPKEADGTTTQFQQAVFHPRPDSAYKISFRYHALPRELSDEHPWPLGGKSHTQGILMSCLSIAEQFKRNPNQGYRRLFEERLLAAIANDIKRAPQYLGYNGNSAMRGGGSRADMRDLIYYQDVTYQGQEYSG